MLGVGFGAAAELTRIRLYLQPGQAGPALRVCVCVCSCVLACLRARFCARANVRVRVLVHVFARARACACAVRVRVVAACAAREPLGVGWDGVGGRCGGVCVCANVCVWRDASVCGGGLGGSVCMRSRTPGYCREDGAVTTSTVP